MIRPSPAAPGVERFDALTPTLAPATHTNSYALGEREVVLVEPATPYEDEKREWLAWAEGIRSQGRELVAILATHHHPDHVGGAAFFKEALGVPLWAHERARAFLRTPVDRALADGEQFDLAGATPQRWHVLHTPGHASDHLCLFDDATVIVGDMVASVGTILVAPGDGDMTDYLTQLKRLEGLEAKVALPAHGDPIAGPSKLFRAYQAHRLMRESWVLKAVEKLAGESGATLDELLPVAYEGTDPALFPIARMSLEAHLDKLERDGQVRRAADRYRAAG
ncbi:MAG: MBL fold metallo-hydrolase [Myxococcales bacterium]|nr:MBL fold metallo-hydrolase [Myxococcales bacterium]